MRVRFSTDAEGIRTTYALSGRWNDRPWGGFEAGGVKALSVSAGVGTDGGYAVTVELLEGAMPAGARTADFAAALGPAVVSGREGPGLLGDHPGPSPSAGGEPPPDDPPRIDAPRVDVRHTHAVVFVGPPFGPADGGRLVSLYTSLHAAEHTFDGLAGASGAYDKLVVALDEPYWRDAEGRTAREHFAARPGRFEGPYQGDDGCR